MLFLQVKKREKPSIANIKDCLEAERNTGPNYDDLKDSRGKQIMDYLSSSAEDIDKIVILDDNDDGISYLFENELILVKRFYGLNENICQEALEILNSKQ